MNIFDTWRHKRQRSIPFYNKAVVMLTLMIVAVAIAAGAKMANAADWRLNAASTWAKAQVGSTQWNRADGPYCAQFAVQAYGINSTSEAVPGVTDAYGLYRAIGRPASPGRAGMLVFFAPNAGNGNHGHVGIFIGSHPRYSGSDWFISVTNSKVEWARTSQWDRNIAKMIGSAYPPASWPGRLDSSPINYCAPGEGLGGGGATPAPTNSGGGAAATPTPFACNVITDGVTLHMNTGQSGPCQSVRVSDGCVELTGSLSRTASSITNPGNGFHVILFDAPSCGGTPGYFDTSVADLGPNGWSDRAASARIETHKDTSCPMPLPGDGFVAYRDVTGTGGGCLWWTGTAVINDLASITWDHAIHRVEVRGTAFNRLAMRLWTGINRTGTSCLITSSQADTRDCGNNALSLEIIEYTSSDIPAPAGELSGNIVPQSRLDRPAAEAADGNLLTQTSAGALGIILPRVTSIRRVVIFTSGSNMMRVNFSNSKTMLSDMTSGGPNCAVLEFDPQEVTWITLESTDGGAPHIREVEVYGQYGPQSSANGCSIVRQVQLTSGAGQPPIGVTANSAYAWTGGSPYGSCRPETIALVPFNEGSGNVAHDICGNHDVSLTNVTWGDGPFNGSNSAVFNGTNSFGTMAASTDFNTSLFTIEMAIYRGVGGTGHGGSQSLINIDHKGQRGSMFDLNLGEDYLGAGAFCQGYLGTTPVGGGYHQPLTGWTTVSFTVDGATMKSYLNGELDRSVPFWGASCDSTIASPITSGPMIIGKNRVNSDFYVGRIAWLRISRAAYTQFPARPSSAPVTTPTTITPTAPATQTAVTATPIPPTPTPTPTPTGTAAPSGWFFERFITGAVNWLLRGAAVATPRDNDFAMKFSVPAGGDVEISRSVHTAVLYGFSAIRLQINLQCARILPGDASALYLDQAGDWKYVGLADYVVQERCGWQAVTVPISDFVGFNQNDPVPHIGFRFWSPIAIEVLIDDIEFVR